MTKVAPGGTWASPISFESLVAGAISPSDLRAEAGRLYWLESRPAEGGRNVAMTWDGGESRQRVGAPFNVRTRVHEYGGAAYAVADETLYFANFTDQRLYAQAGEGEPQALTAEGYRYADMAARPGGGLVAVREDHTGAGEPKNAIVALTGQAGDSGQVLFGESDFVAYPRVSPDGRRIAWIAWDHPNMPWDTTRLYTAELTGAGLTDVQVVAGGHDESVIEPQWSDDGVLHFLSDRTGFWNLYRLAGGAAQAILAKAAEFGGPLWNLGQANYALMGGGRAVAAYGEGGVDRMVVIEPDGAVRPIPLPFAAFGQIRRLDERRIAMLAGSADQTAAVATVDIETGEVQLVRRPSTVSVDAGCISIAQPVTFESGGARGGGRTAHALYYPPRNDAYRLPDGAPPPLIVQAHGGPTSQASATFSLAVQFWTSRGFALVDVDYGGSTGYGRAYRQALNGQWGVVDVEDVIAAARHLVDTGRADPKRVAIHGGSAGGFTVLAALAQSDVFAAGGDFYGVSDLEALAKDTHKFESRYLDTLVGPYPEAKAVYEARSPIHHLEGFTAPLIIFQGSVDPVVPPNQARMILEALRARRVPVAYLEFEGEAHGFRRAETIIAARQAELYFYGKVMGFTPADDLPETPIENLGG